MEDMDAMAETTSEDSAGVVGLGVTGVAGYARPAHRDVAKERETRAGVLGVGEANAHSPGVAGFGEIGVAGHGSSVGVRGRGTETGVRGETLFGEGVLGVAKATGGGVVGMSKDGPGILAQSENDAGLSAQSGAGVGGVFASGKAAQIELVPHLDEARFADSAPQLPAVGSLGQLLTHADADATCRLYLCVDAQEGAPARWAQVLLGDPVEGRLS
ncbi:PE-PGRS family protein [Streptomyces sp. NPDC085481]|uniref:PE-PGRS family protein n=1 Tax=Streptomyces sp. NPDC085481 TaxID=3365727 RepID=UPI0037D01D34